MAGPRALTVGLQCRFRGQGPFLLLLKSLCSVWTSSPEVSGPREKVVGISGRGAGTPSAGLPVGVCCLEQGPQACPAFVPLSPPTEPQPTGSREQASILSLRLGESTDCVIIQTCSGATLHEKINIYIYIFCLFLKGKKKQLCFLGEQHSATPARLPGQLPLIAFGEPAPSGGARCSAPQGGPTSLLGDLQDGLGVL